THPRGCNRVVEFQVAINVEDLWCREVQIEEPILERPAPSELAIPEVEARSGRAEQRVPAYRNVEVPTGALKGSEVVGRRNGRSGGQPDVESADLANANWSDNTWRGVDGVDACYAHRVVNSTSDRASHCVRANHHDGVDRTRRFLRERNARRRGSSGRVC